MLEHHRRMVKGLLHEAKEELFTGAKLIREMEYYADAVDKDIDTLPGLIPIMRNAGQSLVVASRLLEQAYNYYQKHKGE